VLTPADPSLHIDKHVSLKYSSIEIEPESDFFPRCRRISIFLVRFCSASPHLVDLLTDLVSIFQSSAVARISERLSEGSVRELLWSEQRVRLPLSPSSFLRTHHGLNFCRWGWNRKRYRSCPPRSSSQLSNCPRLYPFRNRALLHGKGACMPRWTPPRVRKTPSSTGRHVLCWRNRNSCRCSFDDETRYGRCLRVGSSFHSRSTLWWSADRSPHVVVDLVSSRLRTQKLSLVPSSSLSLTTKTPSSSPRFRAVSVRVWRESQSWTLWLWLLIEVTKLESFQPPSILPVVDVSFLSSRYLFVVRKSAISSYVSVQALFEGREER